ncbi:hypothetical protein PAMP_018243 [Pampus punctatissimus]
MERLPGYQHTVFAQIEEVRAFIQMKIQEHKETLDRSSPRDYIDCFLIRMNQEKDIHTTEFHYDNLVSTVMNLFMAGTETTSSTIRYALSVLIKHPDIQEKMQQEIDSVIGQQCCPTMENRKFLPFTDAVIHEVQRFLDIVPFSLPHYALQDISFRGKRACVGESLTRMELFIFLVSLLQHFTFSCSGGPDSINLIPEYSSFANLPHRYKIIATPR